ncbi:MAG: gliding motility-associated C-terminal domain-containing protein [Elusimicrobiales bacterium]|nr:gliding motility-associated C-terminal domain-containing protein [Elusimicrobiales bacterium]
MTIKSVARAVLLLLAALLPAAPLCAARLESPSFRDGGGILGFGSASMLSSNFLMNANVQELGVSTQTSAGFSQRAGKLAFFPQPSPIADIEVVTISSYSIRMTWTAPSVDASRDFGAVDQYILRYTTAGFLSSDQAFYAASTYPQDWTPLAAGSAESRIIEGFNPGTTYYFALETLNDQKLRSELSNPAAAFALVPLAPMNFKIIRAGNAVTMTWIPPAGYQNRIGFNDRFSPSFPYEVKTYQVFRATAPANAEWQYLAEVSSNTFSWTDTIAEGDNYYYHARALNQAGVSFPSYARNSLSGNLYFLAPDNQSILEVPADGTGEFFSESSDPLDAYSVEITTFTEDLAGRVVKSVAFRAYRGGLQADDDFRLSKNGILKLYYRKAGSAIVPSAQTDAKAISMYYYNGSRWLQMYGRVNDAERSVQLETTMLGRYQLRTTERSGGFSADRAGLTNRLITPNNDGKNDTMVFIFDNPQDKDVKGKIFDLRGALVGRMVPGPVGNSLVWDAKAGGQAVPGGVYIYQIEAQGTVYNGTVAVIR